jgi:hypothetical protein
VLRAGTLPCALGLQEGVVVARVLDGLVDRRHRELIIVGDLFRRACLGTDR